MENCDNLALILNIETVGQTVMTEIKELRWRLDWLKSDGCTLGEWIIGE